MQTFGQKIGALLSTSAIALVAVSTVASAGGFQRGTADTDILFENGTFSSRFGVTYVNPNRGFSSINGQEGDYGDYTGNYKIPSAAVAYGSQDFACAGTYTISFAAEADYSGSPGGALPVDPATPTQSRIVKSEFSSDEFGATCRVSYSTETMRFSLLGGLFVEDFDFNGTSRGLSRTGQVVSGFPVLLPVQVDANSEAGWATGYRIGAAFEIPEIALRAQVLYRSEVEHDPVGTGVGTAFDAPFIITPGGAVELPGGPPMGTPVASGANILTQATSPQSIYINAQTGIAPGTLLLGSFRWTDWSTNDFVRSSFVTGAGTSFSQSPYNWDDGYTASIGIGRAFNDQISGAVSIGYDSGVSTGSETTYTDLYTVSAGLSFKPEKWGEIRVGGLVGYWTDGEQRVEDGAYFDGKVDDTIVLAGSASLKLTF